MSAVQDAKIDGRIAPMEEGMDEDDAKGAGTTSDAAPPEGEADAPFVTRIQEVFWKFLPLGVIAYGGPNAHIALLHERFVEKLKWLSDEQFIELMAVGQGLPGPTSTQMVVSMGAFRAGIPGGLLSFALWNIPSFIVLTLAGLGVRSVLEEEDPAWLSGVAPAAIALVFIAAYKLGNKVNKSSKLKYTLSLISACVTLLINGDEDIDSKVSAWVFPVMLVAGGIVTYVDSKIRPDQYSAALTAKSKEQEAAEDRTYSRVNISMFLGGAIIAGWLLVLLVSLTLFSEDGLAGLFRAFFRIGSIIYGGGQVVLPMLLDDVVDPGWLSKEQFYQGFALVQALPGPLFNFSSYLGAVYKGVPGAFVGWVGLFGPGISLIFGFLPFWARVRKVSWFKIALQGVNATAIGLVVAACVLLWIGAVETYADAMVALLTGCMQAFLGFAAPWCIIAGGVFGWLLSDPVASLAQVDVSEG